jgi:hypothetical protein
MSNAKPHELRHTPRATPLPKNYAIHQSYATPVSYATPNKLPHTPRNTPYTKATLHPKSYATRRELHHTASPTPHRKSYATPHFKLTGVKHLLPGPCPLQCRIPMGRRGWAVGCPRLECSSALPPINRSSRVTRTTSHLRVQQQLIRPIERGRPTPYEQRGGSDPN